MRHFNTPAGEVHSLRFTPESDSIYFLSQEPFADRITLFQHTYRIDTRTGEVTGDWSFSGSGIAILAPGFRSVYHSVSVAVAGGELDLWRLDLATGENVVIYQANEPYPYHVAFTPNGHILAIAGRHGMGGDGRYYVHRLDVWHRTELDAIPFEADCLAYSPDGRFLATGNRSNCVRVWQGKTLAEQWIEPAAVLAWAPDGRLVWGKNEQLVCARPGSGEPLRKWLCENGEPTVLAFSPDGGQLLVGTRTGGCAFHDYVAGQQRASFDWGIGPIHSVAFAPDGLTCAAGGENGQFVIWDVDT